MEATGEVHTVLIVASPSQKQERFFFFLKFLEVSMSNIRRLAQKENFCVFFPSVTAARSSLSQQADSLLLFSLWQKVYMSGLSHESSEKHVVEEIAIKISC